MSDVADDLLKLVKEWRGDYHELLERYKKVINIPFDESDLYVIRRKTREVVLGESGE